MNRFVILLACGWSLLAVGCVGPQRKLTDEESIRALKRSPLVFDATVLKTHDVPPFLAQEQDDAKRKQPRNFILARVDSVHVDSGVRELRRGRTLWIETLASTFPEQIKSATWYTQLCVSGNGLVVREVDHETVLRTPAEMRSMQDRIQQETLKTQVKNAQYVLVAEVVDVRPVVAPRTGRSEHDPDWRIAILQAKQIKAPPGDEKVDVKVEVQFASSNDIAWRHAPRLKKGDKAILLLRKGQDSEPFRLTDAANLKPMTDLPAIEDLVSIGIAGR